MRVKEESEKAGLKLNIQKTKIMASGLNISWQVEGGKVETVTDFNFLGSKITVDGDCSYEIKRHLLLGRKAMTNLNSVLRSRDITLPTKVHMLQKGGSIQGPRAGSCLTLRNELSEETHALTKQEILLGRGAQVESSRVTEPLLCHMAQVSHFMVLGLVTGLSLTNHSDSESFLVAHASLNQDGCQPEGFWEVI